MIKTAMDQGFVDQCIRRGIQDPGQIQMLAKVATDQVNQAEMQKRAEWYQRLLAQANAHPEIVGALAGGGIGAGIGGLATRNWQGAAGGAAGGALLGAGAGYLYNPERRYQNFLASTLPASEYSHQYLGTTDPTYNPNQPFFTPGEIEEAKYRASGFKGTPIKSKK